MIKRFSFFYKKKKKTQKKLSNTCTKRKKKGEEKRRKETNKEAIDARNFNKVVTEMEPLLEKRCGLTSNSSHYARWS